MAKPPNTPPHSDLDGVDEDERRNTDAAIEADQTAADLARARRQDKGRPKPGGSENGEESAG